MTRHPFFQELKATAKSVELGLSPGCVLVLEVHKDSIPERKTYNVLVDFFLSG
jgi:hypothetical protein